VGCGILVKVRLNKAISHLGITSRRQADSLISSGRIKVNGKINLILGTLISDRDIITFDNVNYTLTKKKETKVWRYYKPIGVITTHNDPLCRRTVFKEVAEKISDRVISVGRLDINSEGLLLLTNDPSFAHFAENPNTEWKRVYKVRIFGNLTKEIISEIQAGLTIKKMHYCPIKINFLQRNAPFQQEKTKNSWIVCELAEGKNREIRRIFAYFDILVNRLIRTAYGPYSLGDLQPNELRLNKPKFPAISR
jgi:23S rRNA pseudouridine2605 synthase